MGVNSIILVLEQNFQHRVMIACMLKQIYTGKNIHKDIRYRLFPTPRKIHFPGGGGSGWVGTWVKFCWVCAVVFSEPLPHYSLFCGQL